MSRPASRRCRGRPGGGGLGGPRRPGRSLRRDQGGASGRSPGPLLDGTGVRPALAGLGGGLGGRRRGRCGPADRHGGRAGPAVAAERLRRRADGERLRAAGFGRSPSFRGRPEPAAGGARSEPGRGIGAWPPAGLPSRCWSSASTCSATSRGRPGALKPGPRVAQSRQAVGQGVRKPWGRRRHSSQCGLIGLPGRSETTWFPNLIRQAATRLKLRDARQHPGPRRVRRGCAGRPGIDGTLCRVN